MLELLAEHGEWVLFVMAVAETSFVTGLVVPTGVATSVATVLALQGYLSMPGVFLAAVAGGALGDSVGFWVGRAGGGRLGRGSGWVARVLGRYREATGPFLGRSTFYAVTVARLVSFVRTVMPMAVGMSPLAYRTYLPYDLLGVTAWALMYMAVGLVARQSWRVATAYVGVGWTVVFATIGVVLWVRARRRGGRAAGDPTEEAREC